MSQFVNYKKRSITLPSGCKNLIDLFRTRRLPDAYAIISPYESPIVTRGETKTGRFSEIGKYVAMVFESQARMFTLMVSTTDERMTVDCGRMGDRVMMGSVVFQEDAERERLMRDFFTGHGLEAPPSYGTSRQLYAGVPVQLIFHIATLPSEAPVFSEFVADLFRDICGFSDDSELSYRYYEVS